MSDWPGTSQSGDAPGCSPLLVVITGKPATGKTTLGRRLAVDLRLPFFSKDSLKETLFDSLGADDRAWSRRLGIASFALLRHISEAMLSAGQSLIVEANFLDGYDTPYYQTLVTRHGAHVAQIWLTATPETIAQRFEQRAASDERHPGHVELANLDIFRPALLHNVDGPLSLDGALQIVDTTDFAMVEYGALLRFVRLAAIGAASDAHTS
ncbi:MAG TPA: ATP-binding protein [Ktedonobacterales bacterium]